MFCSNCGYQLENGEKFCSNCGASVVVDKKLDEKISISNHPVVEESKDFVADEIINFLKIAVIALALGLIAIPIGLEGNMNYANNFIAGGDLPNYIQSNKTAHMKKLFTNTFMYSFIIILVGRYLLLIIIWANKRQNA